MIDPSLVDPTCIYAIIYERISQDEMRKGKNIGMRLRECRRWIEEQNAKGGVDGRRIVLLAPPFTDNNVSAARFSTEPLPGRDEALFAVEYGIDRRPVQMWVTTEASRAFRQTEELRTLLFKVVERTQTLERFQLTRGIFWDPREDQGQSDLEAVVHRAEAESIDLSGRLKRGRLWSAEQGAWQGRRTPFGYRAVKVPIDTDEGPQEVWSLEPVAEQAEAIREAVRRLREGGPKNSLRRLCRDYGMKPQTLMAVLLSARIVGLREHWPRRLLDRKRVPVGEPRYYPALWPAIINIGIQDATTQDELRDLLAGYRDEIRGLVASRATTHKSGSGREHLLTGHATHAECGTKVKGARWKHRASDHAYRCQPGDGCGRLNRAAAKIDRQVRLAVCRVLDADAFWVAVESVAAGDENEELRRLRAEQKADKGLLDRLEDKVAQELISEAAAERNRAAIDGRMATRTRRIAKLEGAPAPFDLPRGEPLWQGMGVAEGQHPDDPATWPLDKQLEVIVWLTEDIRIHTVGKGWRAYDPESVEIVWRDKVPEGVAAAVSEDLAQTAPRTRKPECKRGHDRTDPKNIYRHRDHAGRLHLHCIPCKQEYERQHGEQYRAYRRTSKRRARLRKRAAST